MAAGGSRGLLGLWLLAAAGLAAGKAPSCHEVRTAFQLRQIGPLKLVPDVPTAGQWRRLCGGKEGGREGAGGAGAGSACGSVPGAPRRAVSVPAGFVRPHRAVSVPTASFSDRGELSVGTWSSEVLPGRTAFFEGKLPGEPLRTARFAGRLGNAL